MLFIDKFGKYLTIPHIAFSYGHQEILTSLKDCQQRQLLAQAKDPSYIKPWTSPNLSF